ncbi:MAG: Rpn family recombination-promoting nuclease/putative transposase [Thermodesulfobacteriota bacterium]
MSEVANPHDRFVKEVLGQPATARDFLVNYLPPAVVDCLDLSTLDVVKDTFVDPKLAEHLSDLLYQVSLQDNRLGYLYFLFEHRSIPSAAHPWISCATGCRSGAGTWPSITAHPAANHPAHLLPRPEHMGASSGLCWAF